MATQKWTATWAASPFLMEEEHRPCTPSLHGSTLRQFLRISLGGENFRFTLSNEYGAEPLEIRQVSIARPVCAGESGILPETNVILRFAGNACVTVAPGETVTSDPAAFSCVSGGDMAVSIVFGQQIPTALTGHSFANASCFVAAGDHGLAETLPAGETHSCRYFLTGISVLADEKACALVCFGDSITDGVGAEENRFNDWPNVLSGCLRNDERLAHVSVVNAGIGGNKFATPDCVGPSGLMRYRRDILGVDGVKAAIVFIGTNDVGFASASTVPAMLAGYHQVVEDCHAHGITVYAATITPLKTSCYDTEYNRQTLRTLNDYLRSGASVFDGVIDFYRAVEDENAPETVRPEDDCAWGDHLHLGVKGYAKLAETAYDFLRFRSERLLGRLPGYLPQ